MHRLSIVCVPSAPMIKIRHDQNMSGCGTDLTWQKKTRLPTCSSFQGQIMINDTFNDLFFFKDIAKLCQEEIS